MYTYLFTLSYKTDMNQINNTTNEKILDLKFIHLKKSRHHTFDMFFAQDNDFNASITILLIDVFSFFEIHSS